MNIRVKLQEEVKKNKISEPKKMRSSHESKLFYSDKDEEEEYLLRHQMHELRRNVKQREIKFREAKLLEEEALKRDERNKR